MPVRCFGSNLPQTELWQLPRQEQSTSISERFFDWGGHPQLQSEWVPSHAVRLGKSQRFQTTGQTLGLMPNRDVKSRSLPSLPSPSARVRIASAKQVKWLALKTIIVDAERILATSLSASVKNHQIEISVTTGCPGLPGHWAPGTALHPALRDAFLLRCSSWTILECQSHDRIENALF
jgi:hypothetical protein